MKTSELRLKMVSVFGKDIRHNEKDIREFDGYTSIIKEIIENLKELDYTLGVCVGTDFTIYSNRSYGNYVAIGDKKINLKKLRTTILRVLDIGAIVDMLDDSLSAFNEDEFLRIKSLPSASLYLSELVKKISYTRKNYDAIKSFNGGVYSYILGEWKQEFLAREKNASIFFKEA